MRNFTGNGCACRCHSRLPCAEYVTRFTKSNSVRPRAKSRATRADTIRACASCVRSDLRGSLMRRIIVSLIFASTASWCTTVASADSCSGPSAPTNIPEPSTATAQDIIAAQQSVKQYLTDMESALKCIDAAHNDHAHDVAVDDMQRTATKFNTVLRAFRARKAT